MRKRWASITILALLALSANPAAGADEPKLDPGTGAPVATALSGAVGRQVTLMMASGQEVTGTVLKVGDRAVHLTKLAGRDFFDAVILLDRVDGVVVKVWGK